MEVLPQADLVGNDLDPGIRITFRHDLVVARNMVLPAFVNLPNALWTICAVRYEPFGTASWLRPASPIVLVTPDCCPKKGLNSQYLAL